MVLHAGEIIWINPGQLHGFHELCPQTKYDIFIFPIQHLLFEKEDHDQQKFLHPLAESKIGFPLYFPEDHVVQQLTRQLIDIQRNKPKAYELLTKSLLLQLIWHLTEADEFVLLRPSKHDDICKQILTYIHQHYMEKITIPEIAAAIAFSPNYFSTFLQNIFFRVLQNACAATA